MNTATLFVLPNGTIQGLYTEVIDLATLGALHIERATSVEFDNIAQRWRVLNRAGQCLYDSPSREECLRFEHEFFTDRENLIRLLA
jgi:hypothetical protein